jgi:hypothetical protein
VEVVKVKFMTHSSIYKVHNYCYAIAISGFIAAYIENHDVLIWCGAMIFAVSGLLLEIRDKRMNGGDDDDFDGNLRGNGKERYS